MRKKPLTFNKETLEARSYEHWLFLKNVDGIGLVFNDYQYSNTTRRHQVKVKEELAKLKIKPSLVLKSGKSLDALAEAMQDTIETHVKTIDTIKELMPRGRAIKNKERQHDIDKLEVEISVLRALSVHVVNNRL